jgi:mRNA-degrading endonuclease RelE of RelBE toxin-antitoxin system
MNWQVVLRPEAQEDIIQAAAWYEGQGDGLGTEFREAVFEVLDELTVNPFLNCRQHARRHIRWRYHKRFPYRVLYEIIEEEKTVVVAAVIHAARHDRHWQRRVS